MSDDARTWLERGLARYDKKTDDMSLKQLAADTFIAAAGQEQVDLPLLEENLEPTGAARDRRSE